MVSPIMPGFRFMKCGRVMVNPKEQRRMLPGHIAYFGGYSVKSTASLFIWLILCLERFIDSFLFRQVQVNRPEFNFETNKISAPHQQKNRCLFYRGYRKRHYRKLLLNGAGIGLPFD